MTSTPSDTDARETRGDSGQETSQEITVSYEDAMKKLEEIVTKLESGEISLDESMRLFQQGTELTRVCSEKLNAIERQITKLIEKTDGSVTEEPIDTEQ